MDLEESWLIQDLFGRQSRQSLLGNPDGHRGSLRELLKTHTFPGVGAPGVPDPGPNLLF